MSERNTEVRCEGNSPPPVHGDVMPLVDYKSFIAFINLRPRERIAESCSAVQSVARMMSTELVRSKMIITRTWPSPLH